MLCLDQALALAPQFSERTKLESQEQAQPSPKVAIWTPDLFSQFVPLFPNLPLTQTESSLTKSPFLLPTESRTL